MASKLASAPASAPAKTSRQYGLYKNLTNNDNDKKSQLNNIIANLAAADAQHDFSKLNYIKTILNPNNTDLNKAYNSGSPHPNTSVLDEEKALSIVFTLHNPDDKLHLPLEKIKSIRTSIKNKVPIQSWNEETINGYKYTVRYCNALKSSDVDEKKYIDAKTLFETLEINGKQEIALVIDETNVSLDTILVSGERDENIKTYLIKAPEIENDPGGKKTLHDAKYFPKVSKASGVSYVPAIPFEINKNSTSYSYSFDIGKIDNTMNQFFSNYTFKLSELKFENKYITEHLSTSLEIFSNQTNVPIRGPLNNKSRNEINTLSQSMNNIMNSKKRTTSQNFELISSLHQKRTGDWLQALLCCDIANNTRQFCEYKRQPTKNKNNMGSLSTKAPAIDFTKVFLVTHDRILLAFALLLGIDVLYTHHLPSTKEDPTSMSSILMYTITNENEVSDNKIKFLTSFKTLCENNYFETLKTETEQGGTLTKYKTNIAEIIANFKTLVTDAITTATSDAYTTKDNFIKYTQNIFQNAVKYSIIQNNLKSLDIENTYSKIKSLYTDDNFLQNFDLKKYDMTSVTVSDINITFKNKDITKPDLVITYEYAISLKNKYDKLLLTYQTCINKFGTDKIDLTPLVYNVNENKNFLKNGVLHSIIKWQLQKPKYNLWEIYDIKDTKTTTPDKSSKYIVDPNSFLYELNLDDDLKTKICSFYYGWYKKIEESLPGRAVKNDFAITQKIDIIKGIMITFCLEVLINLDYIYKENILDTPLKEHIDDILSNLKKLDETPDTSQSRLRSVTDEIITLDNIEINTDEDNEEKNRNEITFPDNVKQNINSSSSSIDKGIIINYELRTDTDVIQEQEDAKDEIELTVDKLKVNQLNVDKLNVENIQTGGEPRKQQYSFLYTYNNIKAPIYLNVVNLFSSKIIDDTTVENILTLCYNILSVDNEDITPNIDDFIKLFGGKEPSNNAKQLLTFIYSLLNRKQIIIGGVAPPTTRPRLTEEQLLKQQTKLEKFSKEMETKRKLKTVAFLEEEAQAKAAAPLFFTEDIEKYIEGASEGDIFLNDKFSFHPLLPLFLILRSLHIQITNVPIEELWDYDIYISYYFAMCAIVKKVVESYSDKNNSNENKFIALIHGYGFRELFFTSNQYNERTEMCMTALNMNTLNYSNFSSLNSIFGNMACGQIIQTQEDINFGSLCINNPIFTSFMSDININQYFDNITSVGKDFRSDVLNLYLNVGKKISNDQSGIISQDVDTFLKNVGTAISTNTTLYNKVDQLVDYKQLVQPVGGNRKTRRNNKKIRKNNSTRSKKQKTHKHNTTLRKKNKKIKKYTR
jgi:hypothetical protein